MEILMVTPELSPQARATRAGDAVFALSKTLSQLGHRVTVAVPRYPGFESSGLLAARRLTPLKLRNDVHVTVHDAQLPTGVSLVLFDAPALFDRAGIYGEQASYDDNAERFAFLCEASAALVQQRAEREPFDVAHLHDWPAAGAAAAVLRSSNAVATVLTIHDGSRRGVVAPAKVEQFSFENVDDSCREPGGVSLLACGARAAHAVTTVSTTVASDLSDPMRFGALGRVAAGLASPVVGIPSGLDYALFNPSTDVALRSRYDAEDPSNKGSSKTELVRSRGLELETSRPLVAAIVEDEDGADLVERAAEGLFKNDLTFFVLNRSPRPLSALDALRGEFGERLVIERAMDEALVRRVSAAADIVLLPASYDETGTLARTAQRYGALPVARARGAQMDAVVDADAALETGTGFLFEDATPSGVASAVDRALSAYASPEWPVLRRRVMRLDLSWDRPARRYVQVYKQAMTVRAKT